MSQRECAGFNWPGFSVSAGDPIGAAPKACRGTVATLHSRSITEAISPVSFQSRIIGVAHKADASVACVFSPPLRVPSNSRIPFPSLVVVSHEPQSLSDVRGADARSRHTDRPAGVVFAFQVSLNKVEPAVVNCCFNLLSKDD
jgi:hypothetical protein